MYRGALVSGTFLLNLHFWCFIPFLDNGVIISPKHRNIISFFFTCLCFSKSLLNVFIFLLFNCSYITFVFPNTDITGEIIIHNIFHLQTKNTSWKKWLLKISLFLLPLFPTVLFVIHLHISSRWSQMNIKNIMNIKKESILCKISLALNVLLTSLMFGADKKDCLCQQLPNHL